MIEANFRNIKLIKTLQIINSIIIKEMNCSSCLACEPEDEITIITSSIYNFSTINKILKLPGIITNKDTINSRLFYKFNSKNNLNSYYYYPLWHLSNIPEELKYRFSHHNLMVIHNIDIEKDTISNLQFKIYSEVRNETIYRLWRRIIKFSFLISNK